MEDNIKVGNVVSLQFDAIYAKVLEIDINKILVKEVKMRIYDYIETDIKFCIDECDILNNFGNI
jgi:hypothetical protein